MVFCGIFDGHGPWGHVVAKRVKESLPSSLLCNWQETLTSMISVGMDADVGVDRNVDIWRQSCLKTYAAIDHELKQHTKIDSFHSGSLTLVGKEIIIISDSMVAVSWVNGSEFGSLNHVNLIYDIRSLLHFLGGTVVGYNSRSSNNFADCLAKKASNREEDFVTWDVF
ncbi:hypothetical protein Q3G72_018942 [Acer saccharum]|nr:hypothetical protein Q3G72_018942 [Acer saccharum]